MHKFNILHITDAHFGQKGMDGRWPTIQAALFDDIEYLLNKTGALDLIVFTGDVANRAEPSEYGEATRFMEALSEFILDMGSDRFPRFAAVPGNHDVQRGSLGRLVKPALWANWDNEAEYLFFTDPDDEVRLQSIASFENYRRWADAKNSPFTFANIDGVGVLPGDFAANVEIDGVKLGILGVNSTFRHFSDEAAPDTLTVSPLQVQAAAGGDLQAWTSTVDFGLVMSHHPFTWLKNKLDATDAVFGGHHGIKLHLCGHLHEEHYTAKALGSAGVHLVHQGPSLFGLENYGANSDGEREHGYAVVTVETGSNPGIVVWPRRGERTRAGFWSISADSKFGLPKGADASSKVPLPAAAQQTAAPATPVIARALPEAVRDQEAVARTLARFIEDVRQGTMAVLLGDRFKSGASGSELSFASFRSEVWKMVNGVEPEDPSYPTDHLMKLIERTHSGELKDLVSDRLGNPSGESIRLASLIATGPWANLVYLSPLRDLDQVERPTAEDGEVGGLGTVDGTNQVYQLPATRDRLVTIRLASAAPANGTTRLRLPFESGLSASGSADDWFRHATVALTRSPVLFLTDSVNSLGFWRWIAERSSSSPKYRLPGYLVCPTLPAHLAAALGSHGVEWIPSSVADFVNTYFAPSRAEIVEGKRRRARVGLNNTSKASMDVAQLLSNRPNGSKEYLLGRSPQWGDIADNFAAELGMLEVVLSQVRSPEHPLVVLTGTAGSGKTTILMQVAAQLSSESARVAWIDHLGANRIPDLLDAVDQGKYEYVFVDDADTYGSRASSFLKDLQGPAGSRRIVIAGTRSVQAEILEPMGPRVPIQVRDLREPDFDLLVEVLRKHRALANKRSSDADVRSLLKNDAHGQLLVGMIQATSGMPFAEKIASECAQLSPESLAIYGGAALVSAEQESISQDQLLELGRASAQQNWANLQRLFEMKMLIPAPGLPGSWTVRHRVVAREAVNYLTQKGLIADVLARTLKLFASAAANIRDRSDPNRRTFIRLLNHNYIIGLRLQITEIRAIYDSVEEILQDDFHYWLQRGAFEVEKGNPSYAMHYLKSALTTEGGERDFKVLTEYAIIRLRAAGTDTSPDSTKFGLSAVEDLLVVLREHGINTPHSMTVLAREGVAWLVAADISRTEKLRLLEDAEKLLKVGLRLADSNREVAATVPQGLRALGELRERIKLKGRS